MSTRGTHWLKCCLVSELHFKRFINKIDFSKFLPIVTCGRYQTHLWSTSPFNIVVRFVSFFTCADFICCWIVINLIWFEKLSHCVPLFKETIKVIGTNTIDDLLLTFYSNYTGLSRTVSEINGDFSPKSHFSSLCIWRLPAAKGIPLGIG